MLITIIALYVFSYEGSCGGNQENAETKAPARENNIEAFRVDLIRRDSPISPFLDVQNLSNAERLRRAIQRSDNRLRRFQQYLKSGTNFNPISVQDGEFFMQIRIGSPNRSTLNLIVDTGSDLIWTKCRAPSSKYNPAYSLHYTNASCSSPACSALGVHRCDNLQNCVYQYKYSDSSNTAGILAYDTFILATLNSTQVFFPQIAFGCSLAHQGALAFQDGMIGMGGGPLSLISQIGSSINNVFSYCLGPIDNASQVSPLFLGLSTSIETGFSVTPLIPNNKFATFRYLGLDGISVAGKAVSYPKGTFDIQSDGTGGLIIDSGSTVTYLVEPAYTSFLMAVQSSIPASPFPDSVYFTGFDLCYRDKSLVKIPVIAFQFAGGATYVLPPENSFTSNQITSGLICLAFKSAGSFKSAGFPGATSIFGNFQQQNFHIVYDLGHSNLYFAPANCDSL
jgi:hypothetical protein